MNHAPNHKFNYYLMIHRTEKICCIPSVWFPVRHPALHHIRDAAWMDMSTKPLRWMEIGSWSCQWVMQVKEAVDPREMRSGALQELFWECISAQQCQEWLQHRKEDHIN